MERIRDILYYEGYFEEFAKTLSQKVLDKINYVLYMVTISERIPKKFMEHITNTEGLYEIRIGYSGNIYRVFCCFDEGKIVVLFNGFQKKTQKTPQSEIEKALRLKKEYFNKKLKIQRYGNKR